MMERTTLLLILALAFFSLTSLSAPEVQGGGLLKVTCWLECALNSD